MSGIQGVYTLEEVNLFKSIGVWPGSAATSGQQSIIFLSPNPASVDPGSLVVSNTVAIFGIENPVDLKIINGQYRINGGPWNAVDSTISSGDTLQLRCVSGAFGESVVVIVTIDGLEYSWRVQTRAFFESSLNFRFNTVFDADPGKYYISNTVVFSSIFVPTLFTVTDGRYSLNGSEFTIGSGMAVPGDTLVLQGMANDYGESRSVILSLENESVFFTINSAANSNPLDTSMIPLPATPVVKLASVTVASFGSLSRQSGLVYSFSPTVNYPVIDAITLVSSTIKFPAYLASINVESPFFAWIDVRVNTTSLSVSQVNVATAVNIGLDNDWVDILVSRSTLSIPEPVRAHVVSDVLPTQWIDASLIRFTFQTSLSLFAHAIDNHFNKWTSLPIV